MALLYRIPDAARELGVGKSTVYELIKSGELEAKVVGSSRPVLRVTGEALKDYVDRLRSASELDTRHAQPA